MSPPPIAGSERTWARADWLALALVCAAVAGVAVGCFAADRNFFFRDDMQIQYLPAFTQMAAAWRAGEFPLLTRLSWQSGALAGEYQYGVFSPAVTLCCLAFCREGVPLELAAAGFSLTHLLILASGAYMLARGQRASPAGSALVALVASLNGFVLIWGVTWVPLLHSFAWLPWAWWATRRSLDTGRAADVVLGGVFTALLIAAGWPFTVLMLALVFAVLFAQAWVERRFRAGLPILAVGVLGLGLSAPAWMMLLEYSGATWRGQTATGSLQWEWRVPPAALPGFVFPAYVSRWAMFFEDRSLHFCFELAGALVPLALLGAACRRRGWPLLRQVRWELLLAGLALALAMLPGPGNFRFSFRWLPLFFLGLGLAAARGYPLRGEPADLDPSQAEPLGASAAGWALGFAVAGLTCQELFAPLITPFSRFCAVAQVGLCAGWLLLDRPRRLAALRPWLPCLSAVALLWPFYSVPGLFALESTWDLDGTRGRSARLRREVRYLSLVSPRDVHRKGCSQTAHLYPGNFCMYDGHEFVTGYSPQRLKGLTALFGFHVHGCVDAESAWRILRDEMGPGGLLALLGVDGLVVSEDFLDPAGEVQVPGWNVSARWPGGMVLHRQGPPSPRVRVLERVQWSSDPDTTLRRLVEGRKGALPLLLTGGRPGELRSLGSARCRVLQERASSVSLEVSGSDPGKTTLVAVARPWYPGYEASFNGEPVPVAVLDHAIPAVLLPPGAEGKLVLAYRPRSLKWGLLVAALTALVAATAWWLDRYRLKGVRHSEVDEKR
jgi:hypothetical protein